MYFSIIIPLYNKEKYIERCINSILSQSYNNYEIIVVNDGSTDQSYDLVEHYSDSRISIINQENKGVSVARNQGVNFSNYDYVTFIDADDTWEVNYLSELKKLINIFPNAGLYGVNYYFKYANGYQYFDKYNELFNGDISGLIPDFFLLFSKYGKSPFSNSSCCFPKNVFLEEGGYKEGVKLTEDSDLWCRIALKHSIAFSKKPLATYYVEIIENTGSLVQFSDFHVTQTLLKSINKNLVPKKFKNSVFELIVFQQLALVKKLILNGYKIEALKNLFKKNILKHRFFYFIFLLFIIFFPAKLIKFINKKMNLRD
jgi:glycosyltransferase involved in cell wall biosynthesis